MHSVHRCNDGIVHCNDGGWHVIEAGATATIGGIVVYGLCWLCVHGLFWLVERW